MLVLEPTNVFLRLANGAQGTVLFIRLDVPFVLVDVIAYRFAVTLDALTSSRGVVCHLHFHLPIVNPIPFNFELHFETGRNDDHDKSLATVAFAGGGLVVRSLQEINMQRFFHLASSAQPLHPLVGGLVELSVLWVFIAEVP